MKGAVGIYPLDTDWDTDGEEPWVSLQREILMNWPHFIILIINEIKRR